MAGGADAARGAGLVGFLRAELAPTPGRFRDALRIVAPCLAATLVVMGLHVPHGDWIVWTIVQVSSEDAGASLIKGVQRVGATVIGGLVGMLVGIAFADEPQFLFAAIGIVVAVCMFLTRTTSAPDAGLLVAFTMLLVVTSRLDAPDTQVDTALWRVLMILIGVVLGTGAQLVLWPHDPEHRLLDEVAHRLATVERLLTDAASAVPDASGARGRSEVIAVSGLARALNLLANAEARYPSLRRRHTEQIALITETERLLTNALWLDESLRDPRYPYRADAALRARLEPLAAATARLGQALRARHPVAPDDVPYPFDRPADVPAGVLALVATMESTLARIAAATGFLHPAPGGPARLSGRRSPLDSPARAPIFTDAFSLSNTADMKFALKCALGVELCILVPLGLDWPALLTAGVTCLLVAQNTFGGSVYKSVLRLAGAVLGGVLGLAVITVIMPNVEGLAWLLPPFAACYGIAGWLLAGSSHIAYVGLQTGYAFSIATLGAFGPTTDLAPPANRVLGVLLGITVMGLVYHWVWPVRASRAMRPALAAALRAMAPLAVTEPERGGYAAEVSRSARRRVAVYRALATVLRLREDAVLEPGAAGRDARAERDRVLELAGDAQGVFLALLALARHRLETRATARPAEELAPLAAFDRAVGQALQALADTIEGRTAPLPDLRRVLEELARTSAGSAAPGLLGPEIGARRYILGHIERLAREVAEGGPRAYGLRQGGLG